ncbi:myosin heavy chain [Trypanosoma grayi]|uniref:myosin heavy chain n=1 Tax=Trypanosoma grayi TaxID=71804 RepID=UPI0004F49359|nr:myosin heavy chain [Trypanosoma grayi]KEG10751.1 myosin heavy chain [Trypanosoma grayi]
MADVPLKSHEGNHVGDAVYFNHPTESWVRGTITTINRVPKKDGFTHVLYGCAVLLRERYLPAVSDERAAAQVYPLHAHDIHHIVESCVEPAPHNTLDDLLELSYLHDATLLEQVRVRYFESLIYTHIGPIMLALNPYDFTLPNYTEDKMPKYIAEGPAVVEARSHNLPHAWTVAHYSYWLMSTDNCNQSIIVSGESGAGKTETAKIVVKYIGAVSTTQCSQQEKSGAAEITTKVNLTSPILEAFGNAKTKKNDNSSRFGKFMKVFFKQTPGGGVMTGASINVYLLERSRVVTHGQGERGYHSFYQLLASNGSAEKQSLFSRLHLTCAEDYRCTATGGATKIEGVNDAADFDAVVRAMEFVGMSVSELSNVWNTVGAVLHLLSLEFRPVSDDECCIDMTARDAAVHVRMVQELLGLPDDTFFTELTTTTQVTRGERIVRKLRQAQAVDLCEGVAKALYEALFLWLVARINELIRPPLGDNAAAVSWIGLLDIFGFENFSQGNSFEQLCINLANETLQSHYNSIIFTRDIAECRKEGIKTDGVVFYDNQPCLDLICGTDFSQCGPGGASRTTNKLSILHLLNEESALAKGSDLAFREKVCDAYGGRLLDGKGRHPNFMRVKTDRSSFVIKHYAGEVTYNVEGFRVKNSDTTKEALKEAIRSSTIPLIASLLDGHLSESGSSATSTVSSFFKSQLAQLMTEINGTHPHWIRCIKPHGAKKPRIFNGSEVMTQLRSAGVLETVKIRQNSFSVRLPFAEFLRAHKVLWGSVPPSIGGLGRFTGSDLGAFQAPFPPGLRGREAVAEILRRAAVDSVHNAQVGKTKVFLKTEASQHLSSVVRAVQKACTLVFQASTRQTLSRRTVHMRLLRYQLKMIMAGVNCVWSQVLARRKELRIKEMHLIQKFRVVLLMQTNEMARREEFEEEQHASLARVLVVEAEDRAAILRRWMERKRQEDSEARTAFSMAERGARCAVESEEVACRERLRDYMEFNTHEEDAREEVELEEATERNSVLGRGHKLLLERLIEYHKHIAEGQKSELIKSESARRSSATKLEAAAFDTICAIMSLILAEVSSRAVLISDEVEAFTGYCSRRAEEWSVVERHWWARKSITDRRAVLLLQKAEAEARREEECAQLASLAALLGSVAENEQHARRKEMEQLSIEEEERKLLVEEQLSRVQEIEQRRNDAIREAAQRLWCNFLEDERLVKKARRLEEDIKAARTAQARLMRDYTLMCRRKEVEKGKLGSSTTNVSEMKKLEEYRQRQRGLSQSIAATQKLLLETETKLIVFRSANGLHSLTRREPLVAAVASTTNPEAQAGASLTQLRRVSVSGEGSMNLIHRMNVTKGLACGRAREFSMTPSTIAAADRLEAYHRARERRKCNASLSGATPLRAPRSTVSPSPAVRSAPPIESCVQRNPFKPDWAPGPPDADGSYWVFTPSGEQVPLVSVELHDPTGIHVLDSDQLVYKYSPDPHIPVL